MVPGARPRASAGSQPRGRGPSAPTRFTAQIYVTGDGFHPGGGRGLRGIRRRQPSASITPAFSTSPGPGAATSSAAKWKTSGRYHAHPARGGADRSLVAGGRLLGGRADDPRREHGREGTPGLRADRQHAQGHRPPRQGQGRPGGDPHRREVEGERKQIPTRLFRYAIWRYTCCQMGAKLWCRQRGLSKH